MSLWKEIDKKTSKEKKLLYLSKNLIPIFSYFLWNGEGANFSSGGIDSPDIAQSLPIGILIIYQ